MTPPKKLFRLPPEIFFPLSLGDLENHLFLEKLIAT